MNQSREFRIGQGVDVHALSLGRKLVLGTVEIPYPMGLAGHSDADVLLHAVIDAVLGALAWGDIGSWFPDTDEAYRDIASKVLFARVWSKARAEGWQLGNCDVTLIAQEPRLSPHISAMRSALGALFHADECQVSIKATTTEHLGFVGRKEGIVSLATILLTRDLA